MRNVYAYKIVEQFEPSVWNHFDFIGPKTNND